MPPEGGFSFVKLTWFKVPPRECSLIAPIFISRSTFFDVNQKKVIARWKSELLASTILNKVSQKPVFFSRLPNGEYAPGGRFQFCKIDLVQGTPEYNVYQSAFLGSCAALAIKTHSFACIEVRKLQKCWVEKNYFFRKIFIFSFLRFRILHFSHIYS